MSTYNNPKTNGIHVLLLGEGGKKKKKNQILDSRVGCIMVGREKKIKKNQIHIWPFKCLGLKP